MLHSAYTGGIWLAALYATKDMVSYAQSIEQAPEKQELYENLKSVYEERLNQARHLYHERLWIGESFV